MRERRREKKTTEVQESDKQRNTKERKFLFQVKPSSWIALSHLLKSPLSRQTIAKTSIDYRPASMCFGKCFFIDMSTPWRMAYSILESGQKRL